MIRAQTLLYRPILSIRIKVVIMVTCAGTIIVKISIANRKSLPRNLNCAKTYPAIELVKRITIVLMPVTKHEFLSHLKKGDPVSTFSYPASVGSRGMICIGSVIVSTVVLNELESIQTYGTTTTIESARRIAKITIRFLKPGPRCTALSCFFFSFSVISIPNPLC